MQIEVLITLIIVICGGLYYFTKIKPKFDPLNKAAEFLKQNRLSDAVTEYKRALYADPNNFAAHGKIADIYLKMKKYEEATFHLNEIIRINRYDYEVDRLDIEKKLALAYHMTGNLQDALKTYMDILNIYPEDPDALYHIAFSILGQEEFEIAQRYFNRLVKLRDSFEIYFGIGICAYQNKKYDEAAKHFREALALKPESEIAALAASFAYLELESYKEALSYAKKLSGSTSRETVKFISMRLHGILSALAGKNSESAEVMEKVLAMARKSETGDELKLALYDLGFASLKADKTNRALECWSELLELDDEYKNIKYLYPLLDREINARGGERGDEFEIYAVDSADEWLSSAFPKNFLWQICGLKSEKKLDIKNMLVTTRTIPGRPDTSSETASSHDYGDYTDRLEKFCGLNTEQFRIISNRLTAKIGYKVDEILPTYRERDGVDFLATAEREKVLIWVRRWYKTKMGEIPLRNLAQAINDIKADKGILITTAELTDAAQSGLKNLEKVTVVYPSEVNTLLKGLIQL